MESLTTEFQQWIWNAELDARQSSSNFQSRFWLRGVQQLSGRMETRIVSMSTKHINQFSEHSVPLVLTLLTVIVRLRTVLNRKTVKTIVDGLTKRVTISCCSPSFRNIKIS
jgi:hypothetical protein